MLFKGTVEQLVTPVTARVRIPFLHKISSSLSYTETQDLPIAHICTLPNVHISLKIGDVVIVGFENNDLSKPLILGHLFTETESSTFASPIFNSLEILQDTRLGSNTSIGQISAQDIYCLFGVKENIQQQINQLKTEISILRDDVTRLNS